MSSALHLSFRTGNNLHTKHEDTSLLVNFPPRKVYYVWQRALPSFTWMTVSWVIALASGVKVWIMRRKAKRQKREGERERKREREREDTQTQVTQSSNNKDMCTCVYFILEQREREGEEFAWQIEKWNSNSWDHESIWYWIQLWSRVPFTLITVKSEREGERERKRKADWIMCVCVWERERERLSEKDTDEEIPLLESQCKLDSWSREMKWPAILCTYTLQPFQLCMME